MLSQIYSKLTLSICNGSVHLIIAEYTEFIDANMDNPWNRIIVSGINEITNNEEINIFPNPSSGVFRIDAGNNKLKEIKVTDVLGRIVLVANINSANTTIDLSKETKGVYFVQLSDENNNSVNKKIIVE